MIVEFSVLDTEDFTIEDENFYIEHLSDSSEDERPRVYVPEFVSYAYKSVN